MSPLVTAVPGTTLPLVDGKSDNTPRDAGAVTSNVGIVGDGMSGSEMSGVLGMANWLPVVEDDGKDDTRGADGAK